MTQLKIVGYYRLSKPKHGKTKEETIQDAYGLEDQRNEVHRFAEQRGAHIVGEFTEIETGTKKCPHRLELDKAIHAARMHRATIVIGKQDRLARDPYIIIGLMRANVPFIPVDRPDQSPFEATIRATVDEEEARRISERTRRGLAIAKAKGVKLGSARPGAWDGREHLRGYKKASIVAAKVRHERCLENYKYVIGIIRDLRDQGKTLKEVADELNALGQVTTRGTPFQTTSVYRIIQMFGTEQKKQYIKRVRVCDLTASFDVCADVQPVLV